MTPAEFNRFCKRLPATTHVVQWGGADVWKVGGKVFAVGGWDQGNLSGITFKVSAMGYEMLKDQPGLRPAPYLASRGMTWIQRYGTPGLSTDDLRGYLKASHQIVSDALSKKARAALGLPSVEAIKAKPPRSKASAQPRKGSPA
jgi:predicted DNA-binding protein (MmcQ/YjbR family)